MLLTCIPEASALEPLLAVWLWQGSCIVVSAKGLEMGAYTLCC